MKRTIFLFLALLLTSSGLAFGQIDKIMPHFGFMYEFISIKAPKTSINSAPERAYLPFYGVNVGMNYVLIHSNDVLSLGVDPNIQFAIAPAQGGLRMMAQAPVYLLARVGANATRYNEQPVGLGIGIGANYTYVRHDSYSPGINHQFVAPAAVAELNLNLRSANYIIRGHWNLVPTSLEYASDQYDFGNFGLGLIYGF